MKDEVVYCEIRIPGEKGAPDTARTCDLRIRSPLLYPTELQAHFPLCPIQTDLSMPTY